jgi:glycosyltransferase involved in cell wall biosynthesis
MPNLTYPVLSRGELQTRMVVSYFHRKSRSRAFSIEGVFAAVCAALPGEIQVRVWFCRFQKGLAGRFYNMLEAAFRQGTINHIVGDVHYLALALRKRRTVLTIHDCVPLRSAKGLRRAVLTLFWYKLPVRRCAVVTVISEFTRGEVLQYIRSAPERVVVIHNPVPARFVPAPRPFNAARPILLQVGTGGNKNIPRVAEAISGLDCHLDIVGKVSEAQREVLNRYSISWSEAWDLTDEEMAGRYRGCDIVVFASTYEGFGMPIIEGNATGRPVVTSNIGPMPEVAGSAACLVDPLDSSSIRQGILRVINDPAYRDCLIAQGFENVKRFSPEAIAAQYTAVYREVLSRVGAGAPV